MFFLETQLHDVNKSRKDPFVILVCWHNSTDSTIHCTGMINLKFNDPQGIEGNCEQMRRQRDTRSWTWYTPNKMTYTLQRQACRRERPSMTWSHGKRKHKKSNGSEVLVFLLTAGDLIVPLAEDCFDLFITAVDGVSFRYVHKFLNTFKQGTDLLFGWTFVIGLEGFGDDIHIDCTPCEASCWSTDGRTHRVHPL